jgi:diguanylate cyclase (GGDEF)-like protein
MKSFLSILLLSVGLVFTSPALATDLITSRTLLEDTTGALTIADVAGHVVTPTGPSLSITSTKTVHWLCLRVRPPANGGKVVLLVRPAYINEVRLYEAGPGSPQTWKTRVTGNHYAYGTRDRDSISLGFVVDAAAPETTYHLRIKSRSAARFSVQALEPAAAERWDHRRDLLMVFFVTAMLSLLLWAILNYFLDRQPVVGLFAVHQTVYTFFGIVATGYLAPLCPARFPQLADWANLVLYCGIGFTPLLFCRELFKPYEPPPVLMRGLKLLLWAFPVLLLAIALGFDTQAVTANAVLIKFSWLYFVVIAFSLRVEDAPRRWIVRAFFVAVFLSNCTFWLAGSSARAASIVNLTAFQLLIVDGLIIGGLFALMLHTRARQVQQRAHLFALDLLKVQKKFEIEKELKKQAELQAQTDFLTGLYNRRHFVELTKRELDRAVRFKRPLTLLMIDIDHFKVINDTWGHGIGDVVLQDVARLIRDTLRNVDIFGRTGGEEFAAVIAETEGDNALHIAQRICGVVAKATIAPQGAERLQVTVSVGLSELKGREIPFDDLLDEADQAMYAAKAAGRNRVEVCA